LNGAQVATTEDLTYTFPLAGTYTVKFETTFSNGSIKSSTINYQVLENQTPNLNSISDLTVQMNSGQQTVSLSGISDGDCVSQTLSLSTASGNMEIIGTPTYSYTSANSYGYLYFTPVLNQAGTVQLTATISDDGANAHGPAKSISRSFNVYVNDYPTNPGAFGSPSGTELYNNTAYNISWGASTDQTASITYYLEYSLNGGAWSSLVSTTLTSYSNWTGHQSHAGQTVQFRIRAYDGTYYSNYRYSSTFSIESLPVGNNESITINEDNSYTFATTDFSSYSDDDGDSFAGIRVISTETKGNLQYNGSDLIAGQLCSDVTLLDFIPGENEYGTPYATFTFKVVDSSGYESADTYTFTINVSAVDDPPVLDGNDTSPVYYAKTSPPTQLFPDFTLTDVDGGIISGLKIYFSSGHHNDQDNLQYSTMNGISGSFNKSTGMLTLGGAATAANYQQAVRSIKYFNDATGLASEEQRAMTISLSQSAFNTETGHYYEYVSTPLSWTSAKTAAAAKSLYGMQGYLATVTSQEENDFIKAKLAADGWIGGTDAAAEGTWLWATGPEKDDVFSFTNWNDGEPNNSGSGEDYLQIYSSGTSSGRWNDLANTNILGYVVEYGGISGDPVLEPLYTTTTLNVVANISPVAANDGPFNANTGGTVSGNVLTNDTDADGDDLDITGIPAPSQGSFVSFNTETGAFEYAAPVNWVGSFTFDYTVTDGIAQDVGTATVVVTDTIVPVLEVPEDFHLYADADKCGTVLNYQGEIEDVVLSQSNLRCLENDNLWQSFVPGTTGMLKKVQLKHDGTHDVNITFDIYRGEGTSGEHLFTRDYNLGLLGSGWFDIVLPAEKALILTAGETYTFRISGQYGFILGNFNNLYSGGRMTYRSDWDLCFKTYVVKGIIAYDNAGDIELNQTSGLSSGSVFPIGETINTFVVTDIAGNRVESSFKVTVEDTLNPVVLTKNITVELDENGSASIVPEDVDNGSSDNCEISDSILDITDFSCSDIGNPVTVTLTLTDVNGNSASETAVVTVKDSNAPVLNIQNLTVYLDENGNTSIGAGDLVLAASDNCAVQDTTLSVDHFSCTDVGAPVSVLVTLNDVNGNATPETSLITVLDTVSPTAVCKDITVYLDANGAASISEDAVNNGSSDACGGLTFDTDVTGFSCSDVSETNLVELTVTDANGNFSICTSEVTVLDTISPVAVCKDITVYLDANGAASISEDTINNGSSDACGGLTFDTDITGFSCSGVAETNLVELTVTDANANSSTCSAEVTVLDTISPVAVCKDITVYLDVNGAITISEDAVNNGSSDACGGLTFDTDVTGFSCSDVSETNLVELTVTDANSNSSTCSAEVTVLDTISPVANCKDSIMVYLDVNGEMTIAEDSIDNGSGDACAFSLDTDVTSFGCSDVFETNIATLTVTDASNNWSVCTSKVVVFDTVPPVPVCQDITVYLDSTGNAVVLPLDIDGGSADACGIASMLVDKDSFSCVNIGENTVELTITDYSSNVSTCTSIVTVVDTMGPFFDGKSITVYLDSTGSYELTEEDIVAMFDTITDNCSSVDNISLGAYPVAFNCIHVNSEVGEVPVVQLVARDIYGNESKDWVSIVVLDSLLPEIKPVADIEIAMEVGSCDTLVSIDYPEITASDNCTVELMQIEGLGKDGMFPIGSTTEIWLATDESGNTDTLTFKVEVTLINAAPTINEIADVEVDEDSGPVRIDVSGISYGMDCNIQEITLLAEIDSVLVDSVFVLYSPEDSTATINYSIVPDVFGDTTLYITVTDNFGGVTKEPFRLTINPVNDAPYLVTPVPDQVIYAENVQKIPVGTKPGEIFDDIDDEELVLSVMIEGTDSLPQWAVLENGELVLQPLITDVGCVNMVVVASDTSGATATDTFEVCVEGYPTPIGGVDKETLEVQMYPNPTNGRVSVDIGSGIHTIELSVADITGKMVLNQQYRASGKITFNMSDKVPGMYFVNINIDGALFVKKLVVAGK
jgi:hypothetical protein